MTVFHSASADIIFEADTPAISPTPPPIRERISASMMNWKPDVPGLGADGHPYADLSGAFRNRNQHDVHYPDASHQQGHRGDGPQQQGHYPGLLLCGLHKLGKVTHGKVVLLLRSYMVSLPQQLIYLCFGRLQGLQRFLPSP